MPGYPGPRTAILLISLSLLGVAGCAPASSTPPPTAAVPPTEAPTATATPPKRLTICLGEEPNTLFPYGQPNAAALSVREAIDNGPIDSVSYEYQPVILQKLPSLADGDAQILPVTVQAGTTVVDTDGNIVSLAQGMRVRPASCRADACSVTYDGVSSLQLDQMLVTFHLRPDVTWSDGTPVTADDSAYAYQMANETLPAGARYLEDHTQTYEAVDPATTQWWGLPGYLDPSFMTNFWAPAPKHVWGEFQAQDLARTDVVARSPVGWGPYSVQEWTAGDHITLTKNPYYFRASEGYPKFDELEFRFMSDPNAAISELTAGRCDILDPSVRLDGQVDLLEQLQQSGEARASIVPGMAIEWLGLGIAPASYDDGISLARGDRPDILGDAQTRQALALCMDRQKIVDTVLSGKSTVPLSFVPPGNPLYVGTVDSYDFNAARGNELLDLAGWRDLDGDPATPRVAVSVSNVPAGTALNVNYYSTAALQRRQAADILTKSLAECGVGTNVQYFSQNDLYAPGPEGLLFGRRFDLIQYAMSTDSIVPPCTWFTTREVPNAADQWVGTNVTGFSNPEYDAACASTALSLPGEAAYADAFHQAQSIFASELPAIPLYFRLKVAAASADVCHFDLDPSANPLWNIEAFDIGQGCQ